MSTTEKSTNGQHVDRTTGPGNSAKDGGPSTEVPPPQGKQETERECTGHSTSRRKTVLFNYVPRHHSPGKSTEDARRLLRQKEEPANVFKVSASSVVEKTTVTTECLLQGVHPERPEVGEPVEKSPDSDQKRLKKGGKELEMPIVSTSDDHDRNEARGVFPLDALSLLADVGVSMRKIPRAGCHGNIPCSVSDDTGVIETFVKTTEEGRDQDKYVVSSKHGVSKTAIATGTQVSHCTQSATQDTRYYMYTDSKGYYQQQLTRLSTPTSNPQNPTFLIQSQPRTITALSQRKESDKKQGTSAKRKGLSYQQSTTAGKKQKTTATSKATTKEEAQNVVNKACPVVSTERVETKAGVVDSPQVSETRPATDRHRMVLILYAPQSRSEAPTVTTTQQVQDEDLQLD